MAYLELTLPCTLQTHPRYERALEELGALAVTLQDADAETPDEQAIFEPGVGETPLWEQLDLTALFDGDTDALVLLAALEAFDPELPWHLASFKSVEDTDWERAWLDQFKPMQFGQRTWIVPWNHELPEEAGANPAVVRLDPGLAFGSGTHPTTALCLTWLDQLASDGQLKDATMLDFGCGSGILALAAIRLGAHHAVGIDNDPQAIIATRDNAERNGLTDTIDVYLPEDAPTGQYPVVVANILASALDALAEVLANATAPGGRLAMSGILKGQEGDLLQRFSPWFDGLDVSTQEDWVRIEGVRRV